jgi:N6-adenosine-specific RNA methylase IME4
MKYRTIVADPLWPIGGFPGWQDAIGSLPCPYPTMTVRQIAALNIGALAAPSAHVYLWTTNGFLWQAREIAEGWGIKVAQVLVWCKAPMGLGPGSAFASTTEFVLFGRTRVGPLIARARGQEGMTRNDVDVALGNVRSKNPQRGTELCRRWEFDDSIPTLDQSDRLRRLLPALSETDDMAPKPVRQRSSWFQWRRGAHSVKPDAFIDMVEQVSPGPYVELFARRQRLGWDTWGNECFKTAPVSEPPIMTTTDRPPHVGFAQPSARPADQSAAGAPEGRL